MLNDEAAGNFFNQISETVVMPEAQRRQANGTLPTPFGIKQCLILYREDNPPIVQFNDEVIFESKVRIHTDGPINAGDPVYLAQIKDIVSIGHPEIDGKKVPYVYLFAQNGNVKMIFNFSAPSDDGAEECSPISPSSDAILEIQKKIFLTKASHFTFQNDSQLQSIGLWVIPALLPFPLTRIVALISDNKKQDAIQLLIEHCTNDFILSFMKSWDCLPEFAMRRKLFDEAFKAHCDKLYCLTIPALLPQLEGIFTDWLNRKGIASPWKVESRTKRLRDSILATTQEAVHDCSSRSVLEFILNGPVLEVFADWSSKLNTSFPGRHPVSHGKYDETLFTEENSIKIILLFDTVFQILNLTEEIHTNSSGT